MATRISAKARPILVVDDDPATRLLEREILVEQGFRVVEAADGEEALRAIRREPPACVILDIQMPGVDGPAFALRLRTQLRRVPLVILTASPEPQREADRCNAEAYLRKPFDTEEFVRVIRRFAV
ncbi:MAG TPA: response regulator [Candidatus Limnocylindrales bacterium]|nr:response regulator [Candidatus Limnocylindrales bacterium]